MAVQLARVGWRVTVVTVPEVQVAGLDAAGALEARIEAARWGIERIEATHRLPWLGSPCAAGPIRRVPGLAGALRRLARRMGVDSGAGWAGPVRRTCTRFSPGDVDVVLATGSPFASFLAGRDVARRLRCPLVVDYRDAWTGGPHDRRPSPGRAQRAERSALAAAALVLCVSPSLAEQIAERPEAAGKVRVLTNGFDPEESVAVSPATYDHAAVVYAGSFVPPVRSSAPFLEALGRAAALRGSSQPPLRFHYFGNAGAHVLEEARRAGVAGFVEVHGQRPRPEVLSALKGAALAVVVASVRAGSSLAERGIVTGKLFEAIGLGTPVLLVAPAGSDAAEILARAGGGRSFVGADVEGMARFMADLETAPRPKGSCEQFGWPALGARLDELLRGVLAHWQVRF
jgi:glycosyltransferase involved in cell wall biosynthesis